MVISTDLFGFSLSKLQQNYTFTLGLVRCKLSTSVIQLLKTAEILPKGKSKNLGGL